MTTLEEAMYSHITAAPIITNLISTRIYPRQLPQNPTYPALIYRRVSTRLQQYHGAGTALPFPRYQFSCYATSYAETKTLANTLRAVLDGFKGTFGSGSTVTVGFILWENEIDGFDNVAEVPVTHIDFRIAHQE